MLPRLSPVAPLGEWCLTDRHWNGTRNHISGRPIRHSFICCSRLTRAAFALQRASCTTVGRRPTRHFECISNAVRYPFTALRYKWLDGRYPTTTKRVIVKKVLLDQFVMTPPLYVIFYVSMSLMEGKRDVLEECRAKFARTFAVTPGMAVTAQFLLYAHTYSHVLLIFSDELPLLDPGSSFQLRLPAEFGESRLPGRLLVLVGQYSLLDQKEQERNR